MFSHCIRCAFMFTNKTAPERHTGSRSGAGVFILSFVLNYDNYIYIYKYIYVLCYRIHTLLSYSYRIHTLHYIMLIYMIFVLCSVTRLNTSFSHVKAQSIPQTFLQHFSYVASLGIVRPILAVDVVVLKQCNYCFTNNFCLFEFGKVLCQIVGMSSHADDTTKLFGMIYGSIEEMQQAAFSGINTYTHLFINTNTTFTAP